MKRVLLFVLLASPLLPHCTPDFDALSSGVASNAGSAATGSGAVGGGSDRGGVSSDAGSAQGGALAAGAAAGGEPTSNGGGLGGAGAGTNGGTTGTDGGSPNELGGAGGEGGTAPECWTLPAGVTVYNGFDDGLEGAGFSPVSFYASVDTTKGATASSAWDSAEGDSCPGSLRASFAFKSYASGSEADEVGYGTYEFAPASWVSGAALHVKVKVSQANAPILGVRFFVISSDQYLYNSVFDGADFKSGSWNEMVLPTVKNAYYDPSSVRQLGIEVRLARAGTPGIPAQPPALLQVWLDDVWLEPK